MRLVIDANILFAALIKEGTTANILVREEWEFYVPQFIFEEYEKNKAEILLRSDRADPETLVDSMKSILRIVQTRDDAVLRAKEITPDPHYVEYVALALQLDCPIWSNDKRLQGCGVRVITTAELVREPPDF